MVHVSETVRKFYLIFFLEISSGQSNCCKSNKCASCYPTLCGDSYPTSTVTVSECSTKINPSPCTAAFNQDITSLTTGGHSTYNGHMSGGYHTSASIDVTPSISQAYTISTTMEYSASDVVASTLAYGGHSTFKSVKSEDKDTCSGSIVGATVGGALFGSVVTTVVFVCLRQKSTIFAKLYFRKRNHVTGNNPVIRLNNEFNQEIQEQVGTNNAVYHVITDETETTMGLQKLQPKEELSEKDVYNHLHESEKVETSGNYDHAVLTNVVENGYGMVSIDRKSNDNYCEVDPTALPEDEMTRNAGNEDSNQYFTLERQ